MGRQGPALGHVERGKMTEEVLKVGDRMRFSAELLGQFMEDGAHTVIVQVLKIEEREDGLKVVYLGTV